MLGSEFTGFIEEMAVSLEKDLDDTQRIFATLVVYKQDMGVDARMVALADRAGSTDIYWVSKDEAAALKITNDLTSWAPWKIDAYGSGVLAISRRNDNKAQMAIFCSRRSGSYFLLSVREWDLSFASQEAQCGSNGFHSILETKVQNEDVSTPPLQGGGARLMFKLSAAVPFSDADVLTTRAYINACAVNFFGSKQNLAQGGRLALSNCID